MATENASFCFQPNGNDLTNAVRLFFQMKMFKYKSSFFFDEFVGHMIDATIEFHIFFYG
jgi:hypothetical protein